MRGFQFRLDPVMRIKKYNIEQKEKEIAELDGEIQTILNEMEEGRMQLQEMRRRLLDNEVTDEQLLNHQQNVDMYRQYMNQVEEQKQSEIKKLEEQKDQKRREVIRLYQDDKILEKLREKRYQDWQNEQQRQDNIQMDEIGMQKFIRKENEHGGAFMYLMLPMVLAGAALAIALYTGTVDREMLSRLPYFPAQVQDATQTNQVPAATDTVETYTFEDLMGESPDTTMSEALQNIAEERERLRNMQNRLEQKERELEQRENILQQREQKVNRLVNFASEQIQTYRDLQQQKQEQEQSELSERAQTLADTLNEMDPKNAAPLVGNLYQKIEAGAQQPQPGELTENQKIVLRLLRRYPQQELSELFSALAGDDETQDVASDLMSKYYSTSTEELYGINTDGTSSATGQAPVPQNAENLPPPEQVNLGQ